MLRHIAFYCILLSLAGSLAAFELDFTDSGKKLKNDYEFKQRGKETSLTPDGLKIVGADLKMPSGVVFTRNYPDMTPVNAFEFEAKFALTPEIQAKRKGGRFFLWDSRYSINQKNDAKGKVPGGFMVYLERSAKQGP